MPYDSEEQKRAYQREYMRKYRAEKRLNKARDHSKATPKKTRKRKKTEKAAELTMTTRTVKLADLENVEQLMGLRNQVVARMLCLAQQVLDGLQPEDLNVRDAVYLLEKADALQAVTVGEETEETQKYSWRERVIEDPEALEAANNLLRLTTRKESS